MTRVEKLLLVLVFVVGTAVVNLSIEWGQCYFHNLQYSVKHHQKAWALEWENHAVEERRKSLKVWPYLDPRPKLDKLIAEQDAHRAEWDQIINELKGGD
jgi:hypothetical protein